MKLVLFRVQLLIAATLYVNLLSAQADSICDRHGCCCGNDPTPAGVMISHVHTRNQWMISYRFMGMNMSGINTGLTPESSSDVLGTYTASPDLMQMNMHMLMGMYGITNRLTAMAMLNYSSSYMQMTMQVGKNIHHHSMSSSGMGDAKVYALYAFIKKPKRQLLAGAGLNLPTGSISNKGQHGAMMYPDQRLPYMMQSGSGTYDILSSVNYLFQNGRLTCSAQASSVVRTGFNALGYKLGNELDMNAWAAWQWLPLLSTSIRLNANAAGKITGRDPSLDPQIEPEAGTANYGGKKLTAFAGASLAFKKGFLKKQRLGFEWGIPLYQNLNGTQMTVKNSMYVTWNVTF